MQSSIMADYTVITKDKFCNRNMNTTYIKQTPKMPLRKKMIICFKINKKKKKL